jgi:hypothetical protein
VGSKERREGIRKADREALACYARHKNAEGFRLAYGGINTKIMLEDLDPNLFDKLMGKEYRGAAIGLDDTVELGEPKNAGKKPRKNPCKGKNRKSCLKKLQRGGARVPYLGLPQRRY